jgi:hypothetical protein
VNIIVIVGAFHRHLVAMTHRGPATGKQGGVNRFDPSSAANGVFSVYRLGGIRDVFQRMVVEKGG